jgi:hypothetical protein
MIAPVLSRLHKRILVTAREFGSFIVDDEPGGRGDRFGIIRKTGIANMRRARKACEELIKIGVLEADVLRDYTLTPLGQDLAAGLSKDLLPRSLK